MTRIRKFETEDKMEEVIDEYITKGYKVKSRGEKNAKVKEKDYGSLGAHILIFILLGWWTLFIANILYAAYKYTSSDEVLLKIKETDSD